MSDNCSKHKKEIAGISDMKLLAEMIGDLHYESFAELLKNLSDKIYNDGFKDRNSGKVRLSNELYFASGHLREAFKNIESAYHISKPFMKENQS